MKPSREYMIKSIVDTELDSMDMDGLLMYAEDKMWDHFHSKDDKYIEQVFEEMFANDLERLTDE
jgi:hypothetical protein